MRIEHGPSPAPTMTLARTGWTVEVVPLPQRPFVLLHDERALAREHEKPFLHAFGVVERVRFARREDGNPDTDIAKRGLPWLERVRRTALLIVAHRERVRDVEDEPAVGCDVAAVRVSSELASFTGIGPSVFGPSSRDGDCDDAVSHRFCIDDLKPARSNVPCRSSVTSAR
jgi:hypothetical protein